MIPLKRSISYKDGATIKIKPLFDTHIGSFYSDTKAIKAYLAKNDDEHTYIFGGGDLMDCIVTTDPRYDKHADKDDRQDIVDGQEEKAIGILEPYRNKIIGLGKGNHEETYRKRAGHDPIHAVSKALDVPHLGYSGLIKLGLSAKGGRGRSITIRWHHGWGGGARTRGASITRYSKDMPDWSADIYCYGHDHQLKFDKSERMAMSGRTLISKPKILCVCGTFLKTFGIGKETTYSELKGYPPVSIGGLIINIKPVKNWVKMWVDM